MWEFSQLSCPGQTRTKVPWELMRIWQARVCMRVFSALMSLLNKNKSCTRVDANWPARVCMTGFSTLMSWSNENKSCIAVDESYQAEFVWEFSQLSCPCQTRTRVVWELMRVDKWQFVWEFSQLSCPCQTWTKVAQDRVDRSWQAELVYMRVFSYMSLLYCLSCYLS